MKKLFFLSLVFLLPLTARSQAVIAFDGKTHDFGTIKEEDGRVSHDFVFTNRGNAPLVITKVQASCGCTTPLWTKSPVEPGGTGRITVKFNPAGRPGNFNKSISVQSNATVERERLIIKGVVTPKPKAAPRTNYPVAMGDISLTAREVLFDRVGKGTVKTAGVKMKNGSAAAVRVSFDGLPDYIVPAYREGVSIAPGAEQELTFTFDTKECPVWGPLSVGAYVVLDDRTDLSGVYRMTFSADVVEDFSTMNLEQKRTAPILEMPVRSVQLGHLAASNRQTGEFPVRNVGMKSLEIRRVINDNDEIVFKQNRLTVRSGKRASLGFTVDTTGQQPGRYRRAVTLRTNDPENANIVLSIEWEVL